MRNQERFKRNELNANSKGGTELTTSRLYDALDPEDLDGVQIITARVREIEQDKIRIYHLHDLAMDPEAAHLKDPASVERFHKLVFSSEWQYQQYRDYLGLAYDRRSTVILTGVDPITAVEKPKDVVRLIYTSTPHRGLHILLGVFDHLVKQYPEIPIHLDVFSSFGIYGWQERDKPYESLFDFCRDHPNITYHGFKPNDVVREAYQQAHVFSYPCTWPETSCRSLIEGMSARCVPVYPNFSALPETGGGLGFMYEGSTNEQEHAVMFYENLEAAVTMIRKWQLGNEDRLDEALDFAKTFIDGRHSWERVGTQWKQTIQRLKNDYLQSTSKG